MNKEVSLNTPNFNLRSGRYDNFLDKFIMYVKSLVEVREVDFH